MEDIFLAFQKTSIRLLQPTGCHGDQRLNIAQLQPLEAAICASLELHSHMMVLQHCPNWNLHPFLRVTAEHNRSTFFFPGSIALPDEDACIEYISTVIGCFAMSAFRYYISDLGLYLGQYTLFSQEYDHHPYMVQTPNNCYKVRATQWYRMSFYSMTLHFPFTGIVGPNPFPAWPFAWGLWFNWLEWTNLSSLHRDSTPLNTIGMNWNADGASDLLT